MNQLNILLIQNVINDAIKSLHIISNKQATYIMPLHCTSDTKAEIYNELEKLIATDNFHFKANEKGFDSSDYDAMNFVLMTIKS